MSRLSLRVIGGTDDQGDFLMVVGSQTKQLKIRAGDTVDLVFDADSGGFRFQVAGVWREGEPDVQKF